MNKYLKIFLATGIPFAVGMGLFAFLIVGIDERIIYAILKGGVLFGLIITIYFYILIKLRKLSDEETRVHQIREIELFTPYDDAFELCIKSLSLFEKYEFKENNHLQGKIAIKYKIPSSLYGIITISFNIIRISDDRTQVKISAKPIIPTGVIDLGVIYNIVNKIEQFLKEKEAFLKDSR